MLTDKQEKFARAIALEGLTQTEAYKKVYNCENMKDQTIYTKAYEEVNKPKVADRINELKAQLVAPLIMNAQERMIWLTEVIKGEEKMENRLKAMDIINKMSGEYVQKIEADVNSEVTINIELVDDEE